jgi:hypothetical protein
MKSTLRLALVFVIATLPAWGALGEYEGSVGLDQRVLRGDIHEEVRAGYKFHEMTTADGALVREYISPEGKVFAITWRARVLPNLEQLLGAYFPRVQQAVQARGHRGGALVIKADDFVYFSGGRMMNFRGSAYLPALMPKNVTAEVVR